MVETENSKSITLLLNGTISSLKSVIPLEHEFSRPTRVMDKLSLPYGVLIGITGDVKGQLIFSGESAVFGSIGEVMFGMPLEGEMLTSFSGELGNMIAGGLATNIGGHGIQVDITPPTIMEGHTTLSGYKKAIHIDMHYPSDRQLGVYFLLN
ncbi:chemotaxis protein CheX [Paucisalibacillus globulus]|uniref:chemotaxis protein CheX n=1 Tax=Paucisalibacillus globulus TaxID=351095 RepID=UPI00279527EF|nr:chemotaxis protein CheX [Paucisalibacillus globulus]